MKLSTFIEEFSDQPLKLTSLKGPVPPATNPVTKINAYVGTINTDITGSVEFNIEDI